MKKKHILIICILVIISVFIVCSIEYNFNDNFNDNINNNIHENTIVEKTKHVPILLYHHITTNEEECNDLIITEDRFRENMLELKKQGYTTVSYTDIYNFVVNGTQLPDKPIIINFDDGYMSNYTYAYPILKELNMKATIFIIGKMVGLEFLNDEQIIPHFTYEQAKEMYDSGLIDIQSHTYNLHDIKKRKGVLKLKNENNEKYIEILTTDFSKSKTEIEETINNKLFVFSYPYGLYDIVTEDFLKENGIKITVTTNEGINQISRNIPKSLYLLDRISVPYKLSTKELIKKINKYS